MEVAKIQHMGLIPSRNHFFSIHTDNETEFAFSFKNSEVCGNALQLILWHDNLRNMIFHYFRPSVNTYHKVFLKIHAHKLNNRIELSYRHTKIHDLGMNCFDRQKFN